MRLKPSFWRKPHSIAFLVALLNALLNAQLTRKTTNLIVGLFRVQMQFAPALGQSYFPGCVRGKITRKREPRPTSLSTSIHP